jgi:glutamyl/glutaminyl-tRNA synthetase
LFNWAFSRGHGGKFIVRIEDTDQKRTSDAASLGFLRDLKWLGIDWDEGPEYDGCGGGPFGPYFQSERLELYRRYTQRLLDERKAYRAFETPQELEASRQSARKDKRNYRYDRASWNLDDATVGRTWCGCVSLTTRKSSFATRSLARFASTPRSWTISSSSRPTDFRPITSPWLLTTS